MPKTSPACLISAVLLAFMLAPASAVPARPHAVAPAISAASPDAGALAVKMVAPQRQTAAIKISPGRQRSFGPWGARLR
jgi:hypothetical protein